MLVLTTMFINVSNNLPKTAYVKMIDIWLLFNLFKPFVDILLQTYIETLRNEEKRDINHHGKTISVGSKVSPAQPDGAPNAKLYNFYSYFVLFSIFICVSALPMKPSSKKLFATFTKKLRRKTRTKPGSKHAKDFQEFIIHLFAFALLSFSGFWESGII